VFEKEIFPANSKKRGNEKEGNREIIFPKKNIWGNV